VQPLALTVRAHVGHFTQHSNLLVLLCRDAHAKCERERWEVDAATALCGPSDYGPPSTRPRHIPMTYAVSRLHHGHPGGPIAQAPSIT